MAVPVVAEVHLVAAVVVKVVEWPAVMVAAVVEKAAGKRLLVSMRLGRVWLARR